MRVLLNKQLRHTAFKKGSAGSSEHLGAPQKEIALNLFFIA